MKNFLPIKLTLFLALYAVLLSGCGDKFFDPTQIGRFRPVPAVNVILDSLGVADESSSEWAGAEDPKPIDVRVFETDYTFAPGDVVRVSIFELLSSDDNFIDNYIVTETGKISIPEVGVIEIAGLTESQLEEEIRGILSPSILRNPLVTVISLSSQRRQFSILGQGVPGGRSGRYEIPRYDFRLNDALAIAGVATQFNISNIYVTRAITGSENLVQSSQKPVNEIKQAEPLDVPESEMLEIISPRAQLYRNRRNLVITSSEMVTDDELTQMATPEEIESQQDVYSEETAQGLSRETINDPIDEQDGERVEWVFKDGKWIPISTSKQKSKIRKKQTMPSAPALEQRIPEEFDWDQLGTGGVETRVIQIPSDKLAGGDTRYNIVIRPGDTIHVPVDIIGEFYIMGNVNRQGIVALTGRPMTLKMAVAASGGLGPLAWPKRCEVTRRIGKNNPR